MLLTKSAGKQVCELCRTFMQALVPLCCRPELISNPPCALLQYFGNTRLSRVAGLCCMITAGFPPQICNMIVENIHTCIAPQHDFSPDSWPCPSCFPSRKAYLGPWESLPARPVGCLQIICTPCVSYILQVSTTAWWAENSAMTQAWVIMFFARWHAWDLAEASCASEWICYHGTKFPQSVACACSARVQNPWHQHQNKVIQLEFQAIHQA